MVLGKKSDKTVVVQKRFAGGGFHHSLGTPYSTFYSNKTFCGVFSFSDW